MFFPPSLQLHYPTPLIAANVQHCKPRSWPESNHSLQAAYFDPFEASGHPPVEISTFLLAIAATDST